MISSFINSFYLTQLKIKEHEIRIQNMSSYIQEKNLEKGMIDSI